jgi:very-short-patch-repair endonuclease
MGDDQPRRPRRDLRALAAEQHGLFTTAQAARLGLSDDGLLAWSRTGELTPVARCVWGLTGAPRTDRRSALGAILSYGDGASLALGSAAHLWGVPGFALLPAQIIRVRLRHRRSGGSEHSSTRFHDGHITTIDGIPVTTPTRTLFDLAGRSHPARTEALVDTFLRLKLTKPTLLQQMLADLEGRGRPGIVTMRGLIEERLDPSFELTDSNLESRFEQIAREAGFWSLTRQVQVGDDVGVIGRVDFADLVARVLAEVQSERYHRTLTDQVRDRARLERLRQDGWVVLEIPEFDVWHDKLAVVDALRSAYELARSLQP